jgi:hypothetical protein
MDPKSPIFTAAPTAVPTAVPTGPSTSIHCNTYPACTHYDEDDERDASHDLKQPCHGWPELVKVMVESPGFEAFQAFRDLNIKSLLYYQAELVKLRRQLHALE